MSTIIAFSALLPASRPFRPLMRILVCLLITTVIYYALAVSTAKAATYYVDDANGNNNNAGDSTHPWKTIARAQNYKTGYWPSGYDPNVQPGDTVVVKDGNYGAFTEDDMENPRLKWYVKGRSSWITYQNATGHSPVLSSIKVHNEDVWNSPPVTGYSYLIFDGFNIMGGVTLEHTSYIQLRNCKITQIAEPYDGLYAPYYLSNTAAIHTLDANQITVQDCNIYNCSDGITPYGEYWTINHNLIHRIGDDGIHAAGEPNHWTISNNNIWDTEEYRTCVDITGTGHTGTFTTGETVYMIGDVNIPGIYRRNASANVIEVYQTSAEKFYRVKYSNPRGTTIVGQTSGATLMGINNADPAHTDGIQIHNTSISDIVITNNIIHSGMWNGIKLATYTRGTVKDITIANNLVYGSDLSIYMAAEPSSGPGGTYQNINLYNNTFYSTTVWLCNTVNIEKMYNNIIMRLTMQTNAGTVANHGNNIFGNNPNGAGGPSHPFFANRTELVNYNINSLFVNAAQNDFNLAPNSAAINFGNYTYAPSTDILGKPRVGAPDAGCYEYVVSEPNNHATVLETIGDKTVDENSPLSFTVTATDELGSK